jgi:hypothetical protein
MFSLPWLTPIFKKANFEDVQFAIKNPREFLLINTLSTTEQNCLIGGTIDAYMEEKIINEMMNSIDIPDKRIILYGKNANDSSPNKKYKQLQNLGISDIMIYSGGLFEWLLLQDIYGSNSFPTTCKMLDILKYKADRNL